MKSLARNNTTYYYALFTSKSRVVDTDGNYTGEYTLSYSNVVRRRDNISASRGYADNEVFGVNLDYQRTISTTDDLAIDEYSAIWIVGEVPLITSQAHTIGELGIYNGKIYKCTFSYTGDWDSSKWEELPQTHKVVGVAKSLNSTQYAIKEVKSAYIDD